MGGSFPLPVALGTLGAGHAALLTVVVIVAEIGLLGSFYRLTFAALYKNRKFGLEECTFRDHLPESPRSHLTEISPN